MSSKWPKVGGGRIPAAELLVVGYGARQHIRKDALRHLHQEITITRRDGSFTFEECLAQFVADKRITIEVCLTSNQQTVPELRQDLSRHPFAEMRKRRLSTTFCTDNRLVSNTTVTDEIQRAAEAFALTDREVRDILVYGFKRSFFPGTYLEKRAYVRQTIDFANSVLNAGASVRA